MILYKYRTDNERTEDIFRNKKVWFAKPETLNDPLECSIQEMTEKSIIECCKKDKEEQLKIFMLEYSMASEYDLLWGLPKNKIKEEIMKMSDVKDFDEKYRIFADFIKSRTGYYPSDPTTKYKYLTDILKNVGIFSLSETCDNELMWGHYADGGNGLAIGFSIQNKSRITPNSIFLKVKYTNEPIVLKDKIEPTLAFTMDEYGNIIEFSQNISFYDPFVTTVISTKNMTWAYEKEWRCVEPIHGLKEIISPITEVVFGLKCPLNTRKKYIALANESYGHSIRFFEIVLRGRILEKQTLIMD